MKITHVSDILSLMLGEGGAGFMDKNAKDESVKQEKCFVMMQIND